jgi:hypothetical protein
LDLLVEVSRRLEKKTGCHQGRRGQKGRKKMFVLDEVEGFGSRAISREC